MPRMIDARVRELEASRGAVDRAMRALGLQGIRRTKGGAHHHPGHRRQAGW